MSVRQYSMEGLGLKISHEKTLTSKEIFLKDPTKLKVFEVKKWQPKVEMLQVLENLKQILLCQITELGYVNVLFERSLPRRTTPTRITLQQHNDSS